MEWLEREFLYLRLCIERVCGLKNAEESVNLRVCDNTKTQQVACLDLQVLKLILRDKISNLIRGYPKYE